MTYTCVSFHTRQEAEKNVLIAILTDFGFESFEEGNSELRAFVKKDDLDIKQMQTRLEEYGLEGVKFDFVDIAHQNWNAQWESSFQPVIIAKSIGIRAPFHQPLHTKIEMVIEPKMSFGTGHHQTTALMAEAMLHTDLQDKRVLDFGSGTGILSILAERLGAAEILAIDHEQWAFENCIENAQRNNCNKITSVLGDDHYEFGGTYDVILANVNKKVIVPNFSKWIKLLAPNGVLLISGILVTDEQDIHQAAQLAGWRFSERLERDGWLAIRFLK
ncbi:MAG: 50S ribosomal protein L11 methyltransferase [Chitinophagales bacterium]